MRSSKRPPSAFVIGLWIISCAIVLVSVLVAPPANGSHDQNRSSGGRWSPTSAQVVESAGEIVLTFTAHEQGRVGYHSRNECPTYPWDSQECGPPMARASEDYGAVKGEWIFTEAGSRAIRIPIFDDDLDEADFETFFVDASYYNDLGQQTTWDGATIRIEDDDPKRTSDSSTSPGRSNQKTSGSQAASSAARPSLHSADPASSGSTDAGNQSGELNPDHLTGQSSGESGALDGAGAGLFAGKAVRDDNRSLALPLTGLGTLLLVTIATAGFGLKKRLGRRLT